MLTQSKTVWPIKEDELRPGLNLVMSLAHADMGVLMLHDHTAGRLRPVVGQGLSPSQTAMFGEQPVADGPFGVAANEHRRVRLRDAWSDGALQDVARKVGFRHVEILPFFRPDGTLLGAFAIIFRTRHGSRRNARRLESFCADFMGLVLSQAYARAMAEDARARTASDAQEKVHFFARLSHELRTPLQSILGYVDLLRTGVPGPVARGQVAMLNRIAEGARIIVGTIDDLLTFSRLEAGHERFSLTAVSAKRALHAAEAILAPLAMERHVRLSVAPEGDDLVVVADEGKLNQILVNLTANAVKHTSSGGSVLLRCLREDGQIRFDVVDDGTGIPVENLGEIFGAYVQLAASPTHGFGGSGLGLAISREFAVGMNGKLSVSSEVGRGSVFSLTLPAAKPRERPTRRSTPRRDSDARASHTP